MIGKFTFGCRGGLGRLAGVVVRFSVRGRGGWIRV